MSRGRDPEAAGIVIREYQPDWPAEFEALRASLREILGPLALRIDHIGSTAVPGLGAKDVIDIQVSVRALTPDVLEKLRGAGWVQRPHDQDHVPEGEAAGPARWAKWVFQQPAGRRRVNLHVRVQGSPNQLYPLLFRDYLRAHPHSARTVERIKRALARLHPRDLDAYYEVKDPVYDLIWEAAKEWAGQTGWAPD